MKKLNENLKAKLEKDIVTTVVEKQNKKFNNGDAGLLYVLSIVLFIVGIFVGILPLALSSSPDGILVGKIFCIFGFGLGVLFMVWYSILRKIILFPPKLTKSKYILAEIEERLSNASRDLKTLPETFKQNVRNWNSQLSDVNYDLRTYAQCGENVPIIANKIKECTQKQKELENNLRTVDIQIQKKERELNETIDVLEAIKGEIFG